MSHEIENNTRFYSLREPAWHRLGYVSDTALSIDDALKAADMDFEWSLQPVQSTVMDDTGVQVLEIPDKFAVVRKNKRDGERAAFGPVGKRYQVHSAQEIFSFIDELQGGGAVLETVGSLGRGEREFVVVKLPDSVHVGGTDRSNLYLTGTTAFDGTQSTEFDVTAVRVVCANTWRVAKKSAAQHAKIRHTSSLNISNVEKARRVLELSLSYAESMQQLGNRLLGITLRDEDAAEVVAKLFPFPENVKPGMDIDYLSTGEKRAISAAQERRKNVFALYKTSPTMPEDNNTAWGLFNAVTEYADWFSPVRGDDKDTARAERILLNGMNDIKSRALDLMLV
jgi:phage/plasmid-like protein (TIGR03299 family)